MSDFETEPKKPRHWSIWLSRTTLLLGFVAVLIALIGAAGAGQDLWGKMDGMQSLSYAFYVAILALLIGVFTVVRYFKAGARVLVVALAGILLAGGYAGYIMSLRATANSLPMIHDITTDLQDPPVFTKLELRGDNLKNMPGDDDPKYRGLDAGERWMKMHREAYGDIQTVSIDAPVADVFAKAEELVKTRGWEMAYANADQGRIEATDTVSLIKFKDDVVLRIVASEREGETLVDMRSVSRVGLSDLGVNAERIRDFMSDLKAQFPESGTS